MADLQWTVCDSCGHRAHTTLVDELTYLQRQDGLLRARIDWLRAQINNDPAEQINSDPAAQPPVPLPLVDRTAQNLLLGGGTALLVIAAIVFTAVTWNRLGAVGQLAVVSAIVVASAVGAHMLRTGYRSTAHALAGLSAAVATVGALAAPDLGIGPAWAREDDRLLIALTLSGVAIFSAVAAWRSRLFAWHVAVVLASAGAITSGLLSWHERLAPHPLDVVVLAVLGAFLLTAALHRRERLEHWSPLERDVVAVGWILALLARGLGLTAFGDPDRHVAWAGAWLVLGLTATFAATTWAGWRASSAEPGVTAEAQRIARIVAAVSLSAVLPLILLVRPEPGTASIVVVACAVAALLVASLYRGVSVPALIAATAMWLIGMWLWLVVSSAVDSYAGPESDVFVDQIALYLGIVGVALMVVGCVPRSVGGRAARRIGVWDRWPMLWLGAGLGSFALWAVIDADWPLEGYTLPSAALLLGAGVVTSWRTGYRGPFTVAGAALTMALVPAAFLGTVNVFDDESPNRALIVVVVAAALAVFGGIRRWRSILVFGIGVALLAALGQTWAVLDTLPRWVVLGAAGVGLLAAGFGFERLQRNRRAAGARQLSTTASDT